MNNPVDMCQTPQQTEVNALYFRFVKTLVNKCPSACYSAVLAPVLQSFLPYMYERMGERWKYLAALRESPSFDEDNADSQEVMDDVVCRSVLYASIFGSIGHNSMIVT